MSPVGTSVSHVKAERNAFGQHFINSGNHVGSWSCLVVGSPLVEPPAPELTTHQRTVGAQFFQAGKLLIDVGTRTEVHGPDEIVQSVFGEVGSPVALEQGNIAEVLAYDVAYLRYILLALSVRTVFVFDLYHDDGATIGDGQVFHFVGYSLFEDGYTFQKVRIGFAQADIFLFK